MINESFDLNIIRWYSFVNKNSVLLIGKNDNIYNELCGKFSKVLAIENIDELKEKSEKQIYDYIIIYGMEKLELEIADLDKYINEKSRILIIGNNYTGINNWSKYSTDKTEGLLKLEDNELALNNSLINVKSILEKNNYKFNEFFVFPNYKNTEIIIDSGFATYKSQIEKYNPTIHEDEVKIFNEINVLDLIIEIKPEMLEFFTNSYFIEASKEELEKKVKFVSFNNCRKEEYRLVTIIKNDIVEKIPANEKAKSHIENMANIIKKLEDTKINILDYVENGHIYSKFIKDYKTLDRILYEKRENLKEIAEILNSLKQILLPYSKENEEGLHILKNAYWDMIPKNCFYIDNKFIFFDQEWQKENLSIEFIIYRSIINSYDLVREINVDELLEIMQLTKYKEQFERLDIDLRKEIIDEKIYNEMYNKNIKSIDNIINDNKIANQQIESIMQDNINKQEYIENLERINKELKEKIEEDNEKLKKLDKINKIMFWRK